MSIVWFFLQHSYCVLNQVFQIELLVWFNSRSESVLFGSSFVINFHRELFKIPIVVDEFFKVFMKWQCGFKRFFAPIINLLCGRKGERGIARTPEALPMENTDNSLACQPIGARRGFMY